MPRRRAVAALAVTVAATAAALVLVAAPASAGGGCHEATEGTGTTVVLEGACFTPSIVHVDAGATVRFENHDPIEHNVYGTGWGIGELPAGSSGRTSFAEDGLYAFQCTFHPGMSGTIVVGDGDGAGSGAAVTVTGDQPAAPTAATTQGSGSTVPAVAVGMLLGLAIGAGAMAMATHRRRVAALPASA